MPARSFRNDAILRLDDARDRLAEAAGQGAPFDPALSVMTGVGYALLSIADALREQTAAIRDSRPLPAQAGSNHKAGAG